VHASGPYCAAVKLALVTETFPPEVNGVAMTLGVISRELAARGHAVTVYHPRRRDLPADPSLRCARVALPGFPIPGYPQLRLGWPAYRRLRAAWRVDPPDLVHVVTEGPLGYSAVHAARSLGVPLTSSFHTNFHHYAGHYGLPGVRRALLGWLRHVHNLTGRTFVPTAELAEELHLQGFRRLALLSRGVDTRSFHPHRRCAELRAQWGATPDTPVVLHVGRMAAEKNYDLLFAAYAAMRQTRPTLRFVLAGEGPLRAALERQHPECRFAGFFSREEIGRYYASADIYVHASLTETFGNVLTEAMASGLAVTGFDYAAARQFVIHERNGLLAAPDRPQDLIAAAVRLAQDDELRLRLRTAARPAVEPQSWERVIDGFEADLLRAVQAGNVEATPVPA
jgi:glycosyltransferase involved in cell wall biosynthesis